MADTTVKVSFIGDAKKLKNTLDDVDKDFDNLGKSSSSFGSKLTEGFSKAIPVLAGVGAGMAVLGGALKAAAADQASQQKLATTLTNVAEATTADIAATEKWIDTTQRATGVADDELRPALAVLAQGTGSLQMSQELLTLAMNISTGTGKPLVEVAEALSKAYAGNMRGLQALSPEMKAMIADGMTADEAFARLGETFAGQTAAASDTFDGKMKRLKISLDEAVESLGYKLMPFALQFTNWLINDAVPWVERAASDIGAWWAQQDGLKQGLKDAGEQMKEFIAEVVTLVGWIKEAVEWTDRLTSAITSLPGGDVSISDITEKLPGKNPATHGLIDIIKGGKAAGGPVSAGGAYVVGEKGPELLQMGSRGGNVIPNGGGGGMTVIFEVSGRELARALIDEGDKSGGLPLRIRAAS